MDEDRAAILKRSTRGAQRRIRYGCAEKVPARLRDRLAAVCAVHLHRADGQAATPRHQPQAERYV